MMHKCKNKGMKTEEQIVVREMVNCFAYKNLTLSNIKMLKLKTFKTIIISIMIQSNNTLLLTTINLITL